MRNGKQRIVQQNWTKQAQDFKMAAGAKITLAGKICLLFTFMLSIFFSCLISVLFESAVICKVSVESDNTDLTNMMGSWCEIKHYNTVPSTFS
jgi:hypothetical protein